MGCSLSPQKPLILLFDVVVLQEGNEMYQNVKRTCRGVVFAHQSRCFVPFSLPSPSWLLKFPDIASAD